MTVSLPWKLDLLPIASEIQDEYHDGKRFYKTPGDGFYKSVTTIIGEKTDKSWLKAWRDRVGEAEADAILTQAGTRGTAIHDLAEKYVLGDTNWQRGAMPFNLATFRKIKRQLDKYLRVVYGVEYPLYSHMLKTAGRTDLPCNWDGLEAIADFKTSRGRKTREDIPHYFIQATAYALMLEELTGKKITHAVILLAEDEESEARVFIEECKTWYPEVKRVFIG